ncbi:YopX family protein [Enterococcus alishanensis]
MREIKFRAWDKEKKKFIRLSALHLEESGLEVGLVYDLSEHYLSTAFSVGGGRSLNLNDGILMQYTGLKDKNDQEVYEGDIVRCTRGCPHEIIWIEEYGGMFFGGMPTWYLSGLTEGYAWTGEEEIIGNIYENPELLEVEK